MTMLDFSGLKKYIYFPRPEERNQNIQVIYVLQLWGKNWMGNSDPPALLAGDKKFFPVQRCQPYQDLLWDACTDWMKRRDDLAKEFDRLMEKGIGQQ